MHARVFVNLSVPNFVVHHSVICRVVCPEGLLLFDINGQVVYAHILVASSLSTSRMVHEELLHELPVCKF